MHASLFRGVRHLFPDAFTTPFLRGAIYQVRNFEEDANGGAEEAEDVEKKERVVEVPGSDFWVETT